MQIQNEITASLSKGNKYLLSIKQKMNILSSTEEELVAMGNILPQTLWILNFL
jgi:hypothetical protein